MNTQMSEHRRPPGRHRKSILAVIAAAVTVAVIGLAAPSVASASSPSSEHAGGGRNASKPTIVLVHGAWAGASSFDPVTTLLQAQGYTVVNAPNPLRGINEDVSSLVSYVSTLHPEPVVLVGSSYGGMVITGAASQLPNVKGLVYIDAYAPDTGETLLGLTTMNPGSAVNPATDFDAVGLPTLVGDPPAPDKDIYVKVDRFKALFAASVPTVVTKVLAANQSPVAFSALDTGFPGAPAWKTVPSWFFIGTDDQVIPPATQRFMAQRAGGKVVEGKAPHLAMYGSPLKVSQLIVSAAKAVG